MADGGRHRAGCRDAERQGGRLPRGRDDRRGGADRAWRVASGARPFRAGRGRRLVARCRDAPEAPRRPRRPRRSRRSASAPSGRRRCRRARTARRSGPASSTASTRARRPRSPTSKSATGGTRRSPICGSAVSVQSPVPKLLWLKAHEPEVFAAMRRWFTAHAWLAFRLTGAYVVDHHSASQFVPLYDAAARRGATTSGPSFCRAWPCQSSSGPARRSGRSRPRPPPRPGCRRAAGRHGDGRRLVGGLQRLRRRAGRRHDHVRLDLLLPRQFRPLRRLGPLLGNARRCGAARFSLAGGMATGGLVLDWLARLFSIDVKTCSSARWPARRDRRRSSPRPTSPASGRRSPIPTCAPRFSGWTSTPTRMPSSAPSCSASRSPSATISTPCMRRSAAGRDYVAVGGGAASLPLLQLISDVTGVTQNVPRRTIGAALGDARLAAEALWLGGLGRKCGTRSSGRSAPSAGAPQRYDAMFARFKELYRSTRPSRDQGRRDAEPAVAAAAPSVVPSREPSATPRCSAASIPSPLR